MVALPALALAALIPAALPALERVLATTPADSLAAPLRTLEQRLGRSQEAGEVALELGRYHYARGEYREAAGTLARAAARLDPARKPEARYWQGLSHLALQQATEARVTFEEVARTSQARRAAAQLGLAYAWEQARRPDRALEALEELLRGDAGESAPAALERTSDLASQLGRSDVARRAADRLRREYPRSVEATLLRAPGAVPPAEGAPVLVRIGVFSDEARARSLADRARQAGFTGAQVRERRQGGTRMWIVRIGSWPNRQEAERAAKRIEESLGVTAELERAR